MCKSLKGGPETKTPIPCDEWLSSESVQVAPQEQEINSYMVVRLIQV
ncbi:hypothetical protein VCRA2110O319_40226 [Vibrio crassostreae]|nr:hypothetical protein VCRA2117O328_30076 [Vibrio crassostreae]CAK2499553.1 hypothetical protein VCRA2110O319_40226 [Vibrio crassostreae]